jgi:hypothetical protein
MLQIPLQPEQLRNNNAIKTLESKHRSFTTPRHPPSTALPASVIARMPQRQQPQSSLRRSVKNDPAKCSFDFYRERNKQGQHRDDAT